MRYQLSLNQVQACEWGLNLSQSILFAFLYDLASWADRVDLDGKSYYRITKSKVITELPILTDKPNTIQRMLRGLEEKGLVERRIHANKSYVRITEKGSKWNSVEGWKNFRPSGSRGGKFSVSRAEKFPPDYNTSDYNNPSVSSDTAVSSETSPHEDLFDKTPTSKTMPEGMKQQVVEVYNHILGEQGLPKVKVLNTDRRKNLNKCWKDIPQARSLEWWEKYFDQCAKIGWFFTGHKKAPDWRASFGYLCRPDIATNVYEGAGMFVPS